jgi:hypothetical protein
MSVAGVTDATTVELAQDGEGFVIENIAIDAGKIARTTISDVEVDVIIS